MLEEVKFPETTFYVPQLGFAEAAEVQSVSEMFSQALREPVDFPKLDSFVLAGDCVAIVLLGNLPEPVESLQSIVGHIANSVDSATVIAVVSPVHSASFDESTRQKLASDFPALDIRFNVHDPSAKGAVACIANNEAGEPVYVNRNMFDADVVIPVGTTLEGTSKTESFYPEFSSSEVINRFANRDAGVSKVQLDAEVLLAEKNLGAEFSILVVRGPGGNISTVRAGNCRSIRDFTREEMTSIWSIECQADGELVVATIEGAPEQQSWDDIFQALAAAASASQTVRQIVICSELDQEPDDEQMEVLQLQFEVDLDVKCDTLGRLTGVRRLIPSILESTSVFLRSRLSQDSVEEAGLGYIESDREIQRIVDRAASGILLRDAHLCRVDLGD